MLLAPTLLLNAGSGAAIVRPTFSRDFAGEKTLNNGTGPSITFTRASDATYFDADGVLRFAPNNHIRNSEAGGAAVGVLPTHWSITSNANGVTSEILGTGVEDGLTYIDIKVSGTPSASSAVFVLTDGTAQVVAENGQTWTASSYVKLAGGSTTNASILIASSGRLANGSVATGGQTGETVFTPTSAALRSQRPAATKTFTSATVERVLLYFGIYYTSGNQIGGSADGLTLRIAAPQLERGPDATAYNPTTGTAYFGPRFDHSGGNSLGLLIEEARTNSLPNSQMTGIAAGSAGTEPTSWSVTGSANGLTRTIATSVINGMTVFDVAYSGTVSGGPINIALDPQAFSSGYTASSGQTWTGSIYAAILQGGIPTGASFDLIVRGRKSDNTVPSPADQATTVITPTSSLIRYSATRTFNSADTAKVTLDIRVNSIADAASVDFTLRIAAPQLEQGAFPTSYIPTTTAAVTRAADSAVVTPISSFYNQAEGTLFAEASSFSSAANVSSVAFSAGGSADERFQLRVRGSAVSIVAAAATSFVSSSADPAANVANKRAAAAKLNDFAVSTNGGAAETDTAGNMPNVTHLVAGALSTGLAQPLNGHIRRIAYYPKRLSNALLQSLTT